MSFLGQKNDNLKTQGCGAPKDPEIVLAYKTINEINRSVADLENKINNIGSSTPLSFGIKSAILVAVFLAVIGTALGLFGIYQIAIISNSVQTANANAAAAVNAATIAQERSSSAQERSDKNYNYLRQMKSDISSVK